MRSINITVIIPFPLKSVSFSLNTPSLVILQDPLHEIPDDG